MHIVYNITQEDTQHINASYKDWSNKDFHEMDQKEMPGFLKTIYFCHLLSKKS